MFGYIRCCPTALSENEKELYESYYCGLCHMLGKEFHFWNRSFLSYDSTFLALLYAMIFENQEASFDEIRCPVPPFHKRKSTKNQKSLQYAANVSTLLLYYKIGDGILDNKGIKKTSLKALKAAMGGAQKKAFKRYPKADEICKQTMEAQQVVEQTRTVSIDEAAFPTANGLGQLLLGDQDNGKAYKVGYLLGRWVYLMDAVDDFEKDLASGNFNVWKNILPNAQSRKGILEEAERSLNRTLGALAVAYQELTEGTHWPVVSNVVYLGLPAVQKLVMAGKYENRPMVFREKSKAFVEGETVNERSL